MNPESVTISIIEDKNKLSIFDEEAGEFVKYLYFKNDTTTVAKDGLYCECVIILALIQKHKHTYESSFKYIKKSSSFVVVKKKLIEYGISKLAIDYLSTPLAYAIYNYFFIHPFLFIEMSSFAPDDFESMWSKRYNQSAHQ